MEVATPVDSVADVVFFEVENFANYACDQNVIKVFKWET